MVSPRDETTADGAASPATGGDAITAGRVLTAVTCAVLLIGLLVIRSTGSDSVAVDGPIDSVAEDPTSEADNADKPTHEPIVLQPLPQDEEATEGVRRTPPSTGAAWRPGPTVRQ